MGGFDAAELRKAAIIVEGYVGEAGLPKTTKNSGPSFFEETAAEAETAAAGFVTRVSGELEALVTRLAKRHTGWFTRLRYETLLIAMLGVLLFRLGKNFFYDSWLTDHAATVYGLESYLVTAFWLALWCLLLLWAFCRRLRRGLQAQINQLATGWQTPATAAGIFRAHRGRLPPRGAFSPGLGRNSARSGRLAASGGGQPGRVKARFRPVKAAVTPPQTGLGVAAFFKFRTAWKSGIFRDMTKSKSTTGKPRFEYGSRRPGRQADGRRPGERYDP